MFNIFFILVQIKSFLLFVYEKLKLKQILQPPIIASVSLRLSVGFSFMNYSHWFALFCKNLVQILAMVIGAVPVLKKIIFTRDAPLYFFTDSCIILGYVIA